MKNLLILSSLVLVGGCCWGDDPPVWTFSAPLRMMPGQQSWDLTEYVEDEKPKKLDFFVTSAAEGISASIDDVNLTISTSADFEGEGYIDLTVIDRCDQEDVETMLVQVGDGNGGDPC